MTKKFQYLCMPHYHLDMKHIAETSSLRKKLFSSICFLLTIANAFADYADYGRDYSMREGDHNPILRGIGLFFAFAALALFAFVFIGMKIKEWCERPQKATQYHPIYTIYRSCPECYGSGYIKEFHKHRPNPKCPHCRGFGKVLSQEAEKIIKEWNEYKEIADKRRKEKGEESRRRKKERGKKEREILIKRQEDWKGRQSLKGEKSFDISYLMSLSREDFNKKQDEIRQELEACRSRIKKILEECPPCQQCDGKDQLCSSCRGTGKVFNTRANEIYHGELLNIFEQYKDFREGYELFNSNASNKDETHSGPKFQFFFQHHSKEEIFSLHYHIYCGEFKFWDPPIGGIELSIEESSMDNNEKNILEKFKVEMKRSAVCPHCCGVGSCDVEKCENGYYLKKNCLTCHGTGKIIK